VNHKDTKNTKTRNGFVSKKVGGTSYTSPKSSPVGPPDLTI
jgi:hypothetical protein